MPLNSSKIKTLYDGLKANGNDVGTLQEFTNWFAGNDHYANRKQVFDAYHAAGADVGKDYNEFMQLMYEKPKAKSAKPLKSATKTAAPLNPVQPNYGGKPADFFSVTGVKNPEDMKADDYKLTAKNIDNAFGKPIAKKVVNSKSKKVADSRIWGKHYNRTYEREPIKAVGLEEGEPLYTAPHELAKPYQGFSPEFDAVLYGNKNGYSEAEVKPQLEQLKQDNYFTSGRAMNEMLGTEAKMSGSIPSQIKDLQQYYGEVYDKEYERQTDQHNAMTGVRGGGAGVSPTYIAGNAFTTRELSNLQSAIQSFEETQKMLKQARRDLEWGRGSRPGDALRGFKNKAFDIHTWDGGFTDAVNASNYMLALNKADKGEELTKGEQALLDAKATEMAANAYFSSSLSRMYKAGQATGESLPFMLEMLLTSGASVGKSMGAKTLRYAMKRWGLKLGQTVGEKAGKAIAEGGMRTATKAALKYAKNAAARKVFGARVLGRAVGDAVHAAAQTGTLGQLNVIADATNRLTGNAKFKVVTDKSGNKRIAYDGHEEPEETSFLTAYGKAFGANFTENHSEFQGEYFPFIGEIFGKIGGRLMRTTAGKAISKGANKMLTATEKLAMKVPMAQATKDFVVHATHNELVNTLNGIRKRAHISGVGGEYMEEVLGNVENAILVGDNDFSTEEGKGVFNLSDNIDTFLACLTMQGAFSALGAAGYRTPKYRARKAVESADKAAERSMGTHLWRGFTTQYDNATEEADKVKAVTDILTNPNLNNKQRRMAVDYVKARQFQEGVADGSYSEEPTKEEEQIRPYQGIYEAGQEMPTSQRAYAQAEYDYTRQRAQQLCPDIDNYETAEFYAETHPDATDEQKQAARDYLMNKARMDGINDAMQTDYDNATAKNKSFVDNVTNKADGTVTRISLDQQKGDFYVRNGNIVLRADGKLDTQATGARNATIIVTDAQGNEQSVPIRDIVGTPQVQTAEETLNGLNAKSEAEHKAAQDTLNGKLQFTEGERFAINDNEGNPQSVTIQRDQQTGALAAVIGEDTANPMPLTENAIADLQQRANDYRAKRVAEAYERRNNEQATEDNTEEATQGSSTHTDNAAPQSADTEAAPLNIGDEIKFSDEQGNEQSGTINDYNEAEGKYEVEFPTPPEGKSTVDWYTPEELRALTATEDSAQTSTAAPQSGETETAPTAPQPQGRAIDRIPTDENGQHIYEKAPVTDTASALMEANNNDAEEAIGTARLMAAKAAERAERAKQHKDEGETVDEIQKNKAAYKTAQENAAYWENVAQTLEMLQKADEMAAEEENASNETASNGTEQTQGNEAEPKPIGKGFFGNIYDQFRGQAKAAFDFLMKHKSGDLLGVFHRNDLGDIDLVWGDENMGLSHIMGKHIGKGKDFATAQEAFDMVEKIINEGNIIRNNENRYVIELNGYRVGIRKDFDGKKKNWVVTAIDYNRTKEEKGIDTNPTSASHGVEGSEFAAPNNTSADKITESSQPSQKPSEKIAEAEAQTETQPQDNASHQQLRETHAYPEQPLAERTRKACEAVAKALGMELEWVDHMKANGEFVAKGKNGKPTIRIARDAENPLSTVFGHEGTHAVRSLSQEAYQSLVSKAREVVGEEEWNRRLDKAKKLYNEETEEEETETKKEPQTEEEQKKEAKKQLTDEELVEEVVADIVGEMVTNRDMAEQLAYRLDHPTLSALRDVARKLWDAVKRYVGGIKLTDKEQTAKGFADTIERAFADAHLAYAGEAALPSFRGMAARFAENCNNYIPQSVPWGEGTLTDNHSTAPTRYSARQTITGAGFTPHVEEDGRLTLRAGNQTFDKNHHLTVDDLKRADSPLVQLVNSCVKEGVLTDADMVYRKYTDFLNRVLDKGDKGFEYLSDQWAWTGEALYKSVSNNSDAQYAKSVDITRVCKKNEAVINAICELQLKQRYGVTPGQVLDLYNASIEQGFQVPCPVCYVFSRYINNGQYASALIQGKELYGDKIKDVSKMTPAQRTKYVQGWLDELAAIKKWKVEHAKEIAEAKRNLGTIMQAVDVLAEDITSGRLTGALRTNAEKRVRALSKLYQNSLDIVNYASLDGWITNFAIFKKASKKEAEAEDKVDEVNTELTDETELNEGLSEEQKKKKAKEIKFDINEWFPREDTYREDGEIYPDSVALDLRRAAEASVEYSGIEHFRHSRGAAAGKAIQLAADNALGETAELLGVANPENRDQNYSMLQKAYVEADPKKREKFLSDFQKRIHKSVVYAAQQTLRGGIRQWSWSDNIERLSPDVFLNLLQIHMLGGALQAYSKQLEGVELVASMGGYVNGSLMGKGIGYKEVGADYEGEKYYNKRNGKYYALEFDNVVGIEPFDHDGKHGLFYLNKKYDRAGNIIVGMDDIHVLASMADPRIFFIIPWHKSGMSNHILMQMYSYLGVPLEGLENARDYTDVQEEKKYNASDDVHKDVNTFWESHNYNNEFRCGIGTIENGQYVTDKDGKKHLRISEGQKHYRELRNALLTHNSYDVNDEFWSQHQDWLREIEADEFLSQVRMKVKSVNDLGETMTTNDTKYVYPYEYWDMQSTYAKADVNGKRYLEYCRRMGFQPKFVGIAKGKFTDYGNFADEPGYWKLLIDRRMYDTKGRFQDLTPVTVDGFNPDLCDPEKTRERFDVTKVADEAKTKDIVERAMDIERERGYAKTDRTRSRQFVPRPKYDSSSTAASRAAARERVTERYKKAALADGRVLADAKRIIEENAQKNWEKAKAKKGTSAEEIARLKAEYDQAKKERVSAENAVNPQPKKAKGAKNVDEDPKNANENPQNVDEGARYSLRTNSRETTLRNAVIDRININGKKAFLDHEVGQRVLDMANGRDVRQMAFGEPYDYEQYPLGRVEPFLANKAVEAVDATLQHGFANYNEAKSWAKENIARTYDNEETGGKGNVRISNNTIGKFLSQSAVDKSESKDVHMAVLKVLPKVLKTSIDVETHPDFLKGENGKRSSENGINKDVLVHRCYGAVDIDGKTYRVKITLKEDSRNGNLPHNTYSYEATKIELLEGTLVKPEGDNPNTNNSISVANLLNGVEMSYNPGAKVLDESEKRSGQIRYQIVKRGTLSHEEILQLAQKLKDSNNEQTIKNSSTEELFGILRDLSELNANAYKGYGALASEQLDINNTIYAVKDSMLAKIARELNSRGEDVGAYDSVLYFREPKTGIQLSYHYPYRSEVADIPRKQFNNQNPKWDMVRDAYKMSPEEYAKAKVEAQRLHAEKKTLTQEYIDFRRAEFFEPLIQATYEVLHRRKRVRNFLHEITGMDIIPENIVTEIRKNLQSSWVLGDAEFFASHMTEFESADPSLALRVRSNPEEMYERLLGNSLSLREKEYLYAEVRSKFDVYEAYNKVRAKHRELYDKFKRIELEADDIYNRIRFFRTANGEAYGFTIGGKIYIDPRIADTETPIHEYTHLWATALRANNAKEWANVVNLMKGEKQLWSEMQKRYPELKTDDELADEVLAHYSGKRGAERLREEQRKIAEGEGSVMEKTQAISALERVRKAVKEFWKQVADFLHIHYTSAEQVADQAMKDLLDGVDPTMFGTDSRVRERLDLADEERRNTLASETEDVPRDKQIVYHDLQSIAKSAPTSNEQNGTRYSLRSQEESDIIERAKADGTYMKAPNGKQSKLDERQWAQVRTKAFKNWFGDWENDPKNASKVVDKNGEPLVVYHGTASGEFWTFDNSLRNKDVGGSMLPYEHLYAFSSSKNVANSYRLNNGKGEYTDEEVGLSPLPIEKITISPSYALMPKKVQKEWDKIKYKDDEASEKRKKEIRDAYTETKYGIVSPYGFESWYTTRKEAQTAREKYAKSRLYKESGRLMPVFLNIRKPYVVNTKGGDFRDAVDLIAKRTKGRLAYYPYYDEDGNWTVSGGIKEDELGKYDGVITRNTKDAGNRYFNVPSDIFFATSPNQIKSATENVGTYDKRNNDIRYSLRSGEGRMVSPTEMSDEEKTERGNELAQAKAIDVEPRQIVKTDGKSAHKAAEEWWEENVGGALTFNTEIGKVEINENSIGSSLAHRYGQAKLDAITSLKDGFANAVYLGTMPDFVRTRDNVQNHYFAYPINYNGKRCYVFCRAMQDANKNSLYVHEVFIADNIEKGNTLQTAAFKPHGGIALYRDILANVLDAANVANASDIAKEVPISNEQNGTRYSLRTKPDPKKTQKVYKLMRLGEDGKLYPLFIGSAENVELDKWYDADSPALKDLKSLSSNDYIGTRVVDKDKPTEHIETYNFGVHLVDNETGEAISLKQFKADRKAEGDKSFSRMGRKPNAAAVNWATDHGCRWIGIEEKDNAQKRYDGEARSYYNYGINGAGSVSPYAMRPGWHAGSLPTMRQIGKGSGHNLRDDSFVWVEGEVPADIDYNEEAQRNADKDIPDHIPTDGFYLKATNANKKASQADKVGWYVAGAFKPNRIISDTEARNVIDEWNAAHPGEEDVLYDFDRESGKPFTDEDAARANEGTYGARYSLRSNENIKERFKLTDEEKDDATKRIDERIAELHRQGENEQSLKSNNGNLAESHENSGYLPRDTKAVGAQSVAHPSAKVNNKFGQRESLLKNLSNFISEFETRADINAENFPSKLFEGFGLTQREESKNNQTSLYVKTKTKDGEKLSIRLSDHYGNALSIIKKGGRADKGYSIVIETPSSPYARFKPNKYSNVLEFVYKNPTKERLEQIAKGVFDLVDNGEYTDLAGADEIHPSPRIEAEDSNGISSNKQSNTRYSLRQRNRDASQMDMRASRMYEDAMSSTWNRIDEAWHDDLLSVRKLQEALEQTTGQRVRDFENVYLHAVHRSSRNKVMMDRLMFDLINPMLDKVKELCTKHGLTQDEIEIYLNCKHGLERNQLLAQRKADERMANDKKRFAQLVAKYFDEGTYNTPKPSAFQEEARKVAEQCAANGLNLAATRAEAANAADVYVQSQAADYLAHARERDYSGLTGIFDADGKKWHKVKDLEDLARMEIDRFENEVGQTDTAELWNRIHALNNYSLHQSYRSGLISKRQYDDTRKMYQWYVPLRGFNETTADDVYDYLSHGEPKTQSAIREAKGRTSRAADILATMMNMGNSAVIQGNKNQVKQKLLNLALNYDNPLLSVSKAYYVENPATGNWELAQRKQGETWEDYTQRMEAEVQNGTAVTMSDKLDIPLRTMKWQDDEHAVRVKRGGEEYIVYINGNPRAAQALNGLLRGEPKEPGRVEKILQGSMGWLSKSVTSLNPEFVISNFERDLSSAVTVSRGKYGADYARKFMQNALSLTPGLSAMAKHGEGAVGIYRLFNKFEDGTLDRTNPIEAYFEEFMMNGGETGFTRTLSVDDYQAQIERRLAETRTLPMRAADALGTLNGWVDTANRGVENICRFAAFVTSRQAGKSVLTATQDAKEVSTNFNLHGSGDFGNALVRKIALFVNPAIQSVWQYAELTHEHPQRMLRMMAGTAMLGAAMTIASAMLVGGGDGDDDDSDIWHITPFTRRNYLIIPTGLDGTYVKYNLAPELRAIYGVGVIAADALMGRMKHESVVGALGNQLAQLVPVSFFSPQEIFDRNGTPVWKTAARAFTPAYVNPFVEAYAWNEDFMGKPISKDSEAYGNANKPQYLLAADDTWHPLVEMSRLLNNLSGGTDYKKGWVDINPSKLSHITKSYFGGIYQFLAKAVKAGSWLVDGMPDGEIDAKDIPIVSRFVTSTRSDYNRYLPSNTDYKYYKNEYEETRAAVKAYENGNGNREDYEQLRKTDEYKRYLIMHDSDLLTELKTLSTELKEATDDDEQKRVQKRIYETRKRLVDAVNRAEEQGELDEYASTDLVNDIERETDIDRKLQKQIRLNLRRAKIRKDIGLMTDEQYERLRKAYAEIE